MKDTVVIGNGGSELGVRGYVSAYKVTDGALAWRFYTVPGDPAKGADGASSDDALARIARSTWDGDWWKVGGGGTAWDAIVFDRQYNHVYIGVGNGAPWNQRARSNGHGDNLFLSSVVAVDADTGKYAWHYQMTPGDVWDYDATQPITPGLPAHRWRGPGRLDAGIEERILLRDRPEPRPAAQCAILRADELGHWRGPGQRAPRRGRECAVCDGTLHNLSIRIGRT